MLDELQAVLQRPKFAKCLDITQRTVDDVINAYISKAEVVDSDIEVIIAASRDSDDDMFIECAVVGRVDAIVSGDPH